MTEDELQAMMAADERHWWYRGRRRVLRAAIERLPLAPGARVLDAGCGSGRMLDELARYGRVCGVDLSSEAMAASRARGHEVVRAAIEAMPFRDGTFDLVTCLDVIEHTPTTAPPCRVAPRHPPRRPAGRHGPRLPGAVVLARRGQPPLPPLRRAGPARRGRAAGWHVVGDTHFNGLLLAPAAAVRLAQRRRGAHARSDLALTPPALNRLLELPLRLESHVVAVGGRPAGRACRCWRSCAGLHEWRRLTGPIRTPPRDVRDVRGRARSPWAKSGASARGHGARPPDG